LVLVAGTYASWTGLHEDVEMTNAARAGVIDAGYYLEQTSIAATNPSKFTSAAYNSSFISAMNGADFVATAGVNAEENVSSFQEDQYSGSPATLSGCSGDCVSVTYTDTVNGTLLVAVHVTEVIKAFIPITISYNITSQSAAAINPPS
jgi:hypothetical protein